MEPVWWNCDRVAGGGLDFASSFTSWLVRSIAIQSFNELQCAEKTEMETRKDLLLVVDGRSLGSVR